MTTTVTTPTAEDQLKKQNAQLLRALVRVKQERDELLKQLAALQPSTEEVVVPR